MTLCCRDVKTGSHCFSFLKGKWRQVATLVPSAGFFVKIENEMKKKRIPKVCMEATISILCMFIRVNDVTHVRTQFDDPKFWNFLSGEIFFWKMCKNTITLCWFLPHKVKKNMQRKPEVKGFYIHGYDVDYIKFKSFQLHNIVKTDQNAAKLRIRLFLYKTNENMR